MTARKVKAKDKPGLRPHARLMIAIRQQRNWSQLDLANALEVGRSTIACWEAGLREPHPSWVKRHVEPLLTA